MNEGCVVSHRRNQHLAANEPSAKCKPNWLNTTICGRLYTPAQGRGLAGYVEPLTSVFNCAFGRCYNPR